MNDDKIRISPDALIAMIVTEAQDRELARMPSLEEMNEDFQPSEKFQRKMEALVRDTKRKAERKKRLLNVKRFFITLTAAISIFSCTMLPVKAVREAVITTLIEWHDKFVSIIYVNESFNRFLIISLDVLICRYSPLFRAFPALFISEEPHKSFYYPSCFHSQK